jgi:hypothetical protein
VCSCARCHIGRVPRSRTNRSARWGTFPRPECTVTNSSIAFQIAAVLIAMHAAAEAECVVCSVKLVFSVMGGS